MLKIFIGINKHSRAKKSMSGLQKKNTNTKCKEEEITTKLEGKRLSRSVPPEYRQPQKEISKPGSRPRHFPKINVSESHLSSRLECENGNKGDRTADKDSGGSSHKYPIVGLSKFKDRLINNKPGNIVYHDKKGVKINPRSKHSSSGIDEGASSMGLSLNNLNFMSLVRGNDGTPSHKLSSNELNLAVKNDEKSVRMENDDGYETPNLGFQDHPSMKDLWRNSKELRELEGMIEENKITNNINQDSSDCDAVNLILNANDKSAELIPDDLDESSSSDEKSSLSDESLQEITMEKVMQVERYRKPRDSSYKELVQDYQRRSSRASVKKNYCVGNPFHNFYSGMNQKDLEKSQKSEYEDNEAEFLEGEGEYKANFSKQWIPAKKSLKYGKSSVGYKPFQRRKY